MGHFLKTINDRKLNIQDSIQNKLKKGIALTDEELDNYEITNEDKEVLGMLRKIADGETVAGFDFMDFLASPSARVLIPKVLIAAARKSAEPEYLASKFFKKIRLKNGTATIFPEFGHFRAYDVSEGQEINFGVSVA